MATIFFFFFFDDTSPVGKCDIYRRKDKVLTTCVWTLCLQTFHTTHIRLWSVNIYPRNKIVAMTYAPTHVVYWSLFMFTKVNLFLIYGKESMHYFNTIVFFLKRWCFVILKIYYLLQNLQYVKRFACIHLSFVLNY